MHASARSRYGFMRTSRETTLAKGRSSIAEVAAQLRLHSHYVDSAHRLFTSAVQHNFVQGRKTMHVVAVCLYIICRQEKSPHMLIDFSDVLSVNVFTLGSCYLKFCRILNIETPLIDPSLYIVRFAGKMDLGNKSQLVATAALRLVAQMKRDWILTGRRPAGICAAALLIAARQNGFPRTQGEIVKVLRVCGMTVRTRLEEFEQTPAAQLTMEELTRAEEGEPCPLLEAQQDPPAFSKCRVPLALAGNPSQLALEGSSSSSSSSSGQQLALTGDEDTGGLVRVGKKKPRRSEASTRRIAERERLYLAVGEQLQQETVDQEENDDEDNGSSEDEEGGGSGKKRKQGKLQGGAAPKKKGATKVASGAEKGATGKEGSEDKEDDDDDNDDEEDDDDDDDDDDGDDDLSGFVLSTEEQGKKGAIWSEMNRTYLSEKLQKEKRLELELESGSGQEGGDSGKGGGKAGGGGSKKKRSYTKVVVPATAEEALAETIVSKKMSKKINYDALAGIFGGSDGSQEVTEEYQILGSGSSGSGGAAPRTRRRMPRAASEAQATRARPSLGDIQETHETHFPAPPSSSSSSSSSSLTSARTTNQAHLVNSLQQDLARKDAEVKAVRREKSEVLQKSKVRFDKERVLRRAWKATEIDLKQKLEDSEAANSELSLRWRECVESGGVSAMSVEELRRVRATLSNTSTLVSEALACNQELLDTALDEATRAGGPTRRRGCCVVCQDAEPQVVLVPCGHVCLCAHDAELLQQSILKQQMQYRQRRSATSAGSSSNSSSSSAGAGGEGAAVAGGPPQLECPVCKTGVEQMIQCFMP